MDAAWVGVAGTAIGGLIGGGTAWLIQRAALREQRLDRFALPALEAFVELATSVTWAEHQAVDIADDLIRDPASATQIQEPPTLPDPMRAITLAGLISTDAVNAVFAYADKIQALLDHVGSGQTALKEASGLPANFTSETNRLREAVSAQSRVTIETMQRALGTHRG